MTLYCPLWNGSEKYEFIKIACKNAAKIIVDALYYPKIYALL